MTVRSIQCGKNIWWNMCRYENDVEDCKGGANVSSGAGSTMIPDLDLWSGDIKRM